MNPYTIDRVDAGISIAGYPDGSDWVLVPGLPPEHAGVAGPEHVWYSDRRGILHLLHAPSRRETAAISLGELRQPADAIAVSRDGKCLYAIARDSSETSALTVLDLATGREAARHAGLPLNVCTRAVERPDGRVLLNTPGPALILLDPATGDREESALSSDSKTGDRFVSGSPDGRWWLRVDRTALPTHDGDYGLMNRLLARTPPERRYGLTLQLWEAFPLRFVRRIVVAWLTAGEMPDVAPAHGVPRRARLWNAIADTHRGQPNDPLAAMPLRSAYPELVTATDGHWDSLQRNLEELAARWVTIEGWSPDGTAFWAGTHGFVSCAGVDGTTSPRLYTERLGLRTGTALPAAVSYAQVVPVESRRARVIYPQGTATFDGAPDPRPYEPRAIPASRDGWIPRSQDPAGRDLTAARRQIESLLAHRSELRVPLRDWSEDTCAAAIDALAAQLDEGIYQRASGGELRITFELGGASIGDERFFDEVRTRCPGAAPAIRRLLERYIAVARPGSALSSDAREGHEFLTHAAHALGLLDPAALPLLRRYGALSDLEHQYRFARETVPAVIATHGWADDMLDFAFWVLVWNFYNALPDYGKVWRAWGLGDAVERHEPRAFARHVAAGLAATIRQKDDPAYYGTGGFDRLAREIPHPHSGGLRTFLDELHLTIGDAEAKPPTAVS